MVIKKLDSKTTMITNVKFSSKVETIITRGIRMRWEAPIALIVFIVGIILAASIQ